MGRAEESFSLKLRKRKKNENLNMGGPFYIHEYSWSESRKAGGLVTNITSVAVGLYGSFELPSSQSMKLEVNAEWNRMGNSWHNLQPFLQLLTNLSLFVFLKQNTYKIKWFQCHRILMDLWWTELLVRQKLFRYVILRGNFDVFLFTQNSERIDETKFYRPND